MIGYNVKFYSAEFSDSKHDGTARGEQKHLGFLDDQMVEMPEDQNVNHNLPINSGKNKNKKWDKNVPFKRNYVIL